MAAQAGSLFEEAVLIWAQDSLGRLTRLRTRRTRRELHLACNIDAFRKTNQDPVEAKTSGLLYPVSKDEWGVEGTDQIPDAYILQCMGHMMAMRPALEPDVCHVPTFIGGRGFVMYRVHWDPELAEEIAIKLLSFWKRHVEEGVPPEGEASLDLLRRRIRRPKKIISIPSDMVSVWNGVKEQIRELDKDRKTMEAQILQNLGDAEIGRMDDGHELVVTSFERRTIDSKRLRDELPEISEEYTKVGTQTRVTRRKFEGDNGDHSNSTSTS